MSELVSIITPNYNGEKFIKKTIDSILCQTYENFELIVVDDCSTDNSIEIIKSYDDKRIKLIQNEKNEGAAVSRNKALKMATGKWVAFCDGDDLWLPEKLEKQVKFMKEHNYAFSYTGYEVVDENGNKTGTVISGPSVVNKFLLSCYNWLGCLTVMYDVEKIGLIQVPNIRKRNDWAMWLMAIKFSNCHLLNENLSLYRKRENSISRESKVTMIRYHYRVYRDVVNYSVVKSLIMNAINVASYFIRKFIFVKNGEQ